MQKRDFETDQKMLSRFRDPTKIFRDPRFSRYQSLYDCWRLSFVVMKSYLIIFERRFQIHKTLLLQTDSFWTIKVENYNIRKEFNVQTLLCEL